MVAVVLRLGVGCWVWVVDAGVGCACACACVSCCCCCCLNVDHIDKSNAKPCRSVLDENNMLPNIIQ